MSQRLNLTRSRYFNLSLAMVTAIIVSLSHLQKTQKELLQKRRKVDIATLFNSTVVSGLPKHIYITDSQ